ncbi:MAG TPA: glycosyltransferase family 2 protein [Methylomirabilota bacterium]|nr:glycosyltransferase family 2 protein [Methylomirabilota bacterium]
MKPLVSILIPAYNAEQWIADAIQSALRQTWPEKEIIVVDDGSTDRTSAIADEFSTQGVLAAFQSHQGAAAARNKAFSLCHGDFIQWLDADDLLAPDKISRQMELAEQISNPRALFSSEWGRFIYCASRARFSPTPLWADLPPAEWLLRKLAENLFMPPMTWLASRDLTEAAGPWDERLSLDDDGEYFCRMILASEKIHFVSGAKTFYRASGSGSLSNVDQSAKKLESLWLSMQLHVRYLRSREDSGRARAACVAYLQNWLEYFHPWRPDIVGEAKQLAETLGGSLEIPRLRRKYAWLEKFLGRSAAARAQQSLPNFKMALARSWDKALLQFEKTARI